MPGYKYIVQRAITGEFLEYDLPLTTDGPVWELSGPGSLTGTLAPDVGSLRAADGSLLLDEWGTFIYAEASGQIRWGGILISSTFEGEEWRIEAAGFTTYPHGIPYAGLYSKVQVDPAKAVVEVWRHLQEYPAGDLNVLVTADPTPTRLGTPAQPAYEEVFVDETWQKVSAVPASRVTRDAETNLRADIAYDASTIPVDDLNTTQTDIDKATAARAILFQMSNGKPIFDDWNFVGCPAEVTQYHQTLRDAWAVVRNPHQWLSQYVKSHSPTSKQTIAAALIRDRMESGLLIYEDWTWPHPPGGYVDVPDRTDAQEDDAILAAGYMPEFVGQYNDALIDGFESDTDANVFLTEYIARNDGLGNFTALPLPFVVDIGEEKVLVQGRGDRAFTNCVRGYGDTISAQHNSGTQVTYTGTKRRDVEEVDADPYLLAWYESPDCGEELDSLVSQAGYEYTESHAWSGNEIVHRVRYAYPRLGRKLDELAFVQGDNVANVVAVEVEGDDFANEVLGLGSGEGRTTLLRTIAERDGRLRRPHVYSDKAVSSVPRMDALIREELNRRREMLRISSIDVVDHVNAPIGSFNLGDDILVDAVVPWLGRVRLWCRITGYQLIGDTTARLTLARSDSFRYGG